VTIPSRRCNNRASGLLLIASLSWRSRGGPGCPSSSLADASHWCCGRKRENAKIYASAGESAHLAATLQSGVIVYIRSCDGDWRLVDGDGFNGYIPQVKLWGAYPNEKIE